MGEETQDSSLSKLDSSQLEMMKEMCLVVDENDKVIDSVSKIDCHRGKGIRHRAFSVLIFDSENRLLMQQRSIEKITFPGIWANSCCSHPLDIENENGDEIEGVIHASKRKMFQELGISEEVSSGWDYNHIGRFEYSCRWDDEWIEHEIDHVLVVRASPELSINENEIMDTRWLTHQEINQMLEGENEWKNSIIAPWFRMIWKHFIDPHYPNMEALTKSKISKIINCGRLSINSKSEGLELKSALGKHKIIVEKESPFYAPNVFTPNDDGENDVFFPNVMCATNFELWIMNRWGEEIFYSNDMSQGWDGKYKETLCPQGIYSWKVRYQGVKEKQVQLGHIHLMR